MNIARQGSTLRVTEIPELGAASPPLFSSILADLLSPDVRQVEFDLTATEFVDCTGAGALVSFRRLAQRENPGLDVRVLTPRAAVRRLFALLGLDRLFTVCASQPAAAPSSIKAEMAARPSSLPTPGTLPLLQQIETAPGQGTAQAWVNNPMVCGS